MTSALSLAGVTVMTAEVEVDGAGRHASGWRDSMSPTRTGWKQIARPVFLASAPAGSTMTADLWDALAEDELPRDFWVIAPTDA